jgi:hypothetical protein
MDAGSETFDLFGFTDYKGKACSGKWIVKRRTAKDRFRRALKRVGDWCREHRHDKVRKQQRVLGQTLCGQVGYFGITGNLRRSHASWTSRRGCGEQVRRRRAGPRFAGGAHQNVHLRA